jgi:hypothetical protein
MSCRAYSRTALIRNRNRNRSRALRVAADAARRLAP